MNSYEPGTNFRAWGFAIARNKVMQYRDKQSRANRVVLSEKVMESVESGRCEISPEGLEAKLQALGQCLALLNRPERELISMRYSENHREQRNTLSRPAASVRVALCRIRGKLRECVERRIRLKEALT